MRKFCLTIILMLLLFSCAQAGGLMIRQPENGAEIHPGKAVIIAFETEQSGSAEIRIAGDSGETVIAAGFQAAAGYNAMLWNGTGEGIPLAKGEYRLQVILNGEQAETALRLGDPAPYFLHLSAGDAVIAADRPLHIEYSVSEASQMSATLLRDSEEIPLVRVLASAGENAFDWDGYAEGERLPAGEYTLILMLTGDSGIQSTQEHLTVTVEEAAETQPAVSAGLPAAEGAFTPISESPYGARAGETGYWVTPMDITDEAAVWAMLTAPVTVLDSGKKNAQKAQVTIRSQPSERSAGVGVVTMVSQSVRVLERGDEWSLIECYSSSFHDSAVKAWNMLVQGYVPTKYLKTVTPDQEIGYVVDKLTQRLYIFRNGHLYDTLLVSTGHANEKQPYNETRSGEFLLLVPAVGGYVDNGMYVEKAIRFNGGDLLHQVPYTKAKDGGKYFGTFEPRLGTKASHGCIRVQRRKTPQDVSIEWVWKNKRNNQKLVIWEDWQGRQIPYPDADTVLYYNPQKGSYYHSCATCNSAKNVTFTPFAYAELESGSFAKLTACAWCNPPMRRADIDAINAVYAPGGDHDPVLTEARRKYLEGK